MHCWSYGKMEIIQISDFLYDVYEGLCEGDEPVTMWLQLTELYHVIKGLMDATFETKDQGLKVLSATLEYRARICKQRIDAKLAVRN
jgi:hypothetical protein